MLDKFLRWFSRTRLWVWFSKYLVAHVTFRVWGYPEFPMHKFYDLMRVLRASAAEGPALFVFVSTDKQSLASKLIRGISRAKYSHAGILNVEGLLGGADPSGESLRIDHMMGEGLQDWHLLALLREISDFAVCRYEVTPDVRAEIHRRQSQYRASGVPYDFQQELESVDKMSCSEFVFRVLKDLPYRRGEDSSARVYPHTELGRLVFEPDSVREQCSKVVWEFNS